MMLRLMLVAVLTLTRFNAAFCGEAPSDGGMIGNGGDIVACPDGKNEVLDIFEAREMRGIPLTVGAEQMSVDELMGQFIQRVRRIDPGRADLYSGWYRDFAKESLFKSGIVLVDVPDSRHLTLPVGCEIKQIAIQREPKFSEDRRYLINLDLWNTLDNANRAVLVLHELIYRDAIHQRHTDSINTRYFNSYIFSNKISNFTLPTYLDFLNKIGLKSSLRVQNFDFYLGSVRFYENGILKDGNLFHKSYMTVQGKEVQLGYDYYRSGEFNYVYFDTVGKLRGATVNGIGQKLKYPQSSEGVVMLLGLGCLTFDANGDIESWKSGHGCRKIQ